MPRAVENAISYHEVMRAAREVSRTWNVRIHFLMSLPIREDTGKAFDIRVVALLPDAKYTWMEHVGVSRAWPTNSAKTMTGLLLALVYELDAKMQREDETDELARSAPRLPGF